MSVPCSRSAPACTSRIVLERNPNYRRVAYDFESPGVDARLAAEVPRLHGRRLLLIDRVEVSIIEESEPRWLAFQQGKLDMLAVPIDFNSLAAPGDRLAPHLARHGVTLTRTALADIALPYFNMDAIGLRIEFRIAQWPELRKQSLAGKLMMCGFGWESVAPDSGLSFGFAYCSNRGETNDARLGLSAYDRLYERSFLLSDGPERLAVLNEAARLLAAYRPYKFHMHRIQSDLVQPCLVCCARHPFARRWWDRVDIDPQRQAGA